MVRTSLQALLQSTPTTSSKPELVSEVLCNAVRRLDQSIRSDLLDFLPHDHLTKMNDVQLNRHVSLRDSEWNTISTRCTQGSTVLLALSDPLKKNVWILNLGDSIAGNVQPLSSHISFLTLSQFLAADPCLGNGLRRSSMLYIIVATPRKGGAYNKSIHQSKLVCATTECSDIWLPPEVFLKLRSFI
jgi:hypothetical protein